MGLAAPLEWWPRAGSDSAARSSLRRRSGGPRCVMLEAPWRAKFNFQQPRPNPVRALMRCGWGIERGMAPMP